MTTRLSSSTAPESAPHTASGPSSSVGVVGAGVMGSGIAQVLAVAGCTVIVRDIDRGVVERARELIRSGPFGLDAAVQRGKLTAAGADEAAARISYATDLRGFIDLDVIVEAVPEDLALKIAIFRELDTRTHPRTVLASNSSGFPISALAAATDRADRVIGWHWASPVPAMRLAEIVRAPRTSQDTVDTIVGLAEAAGKNPVVINDSATNWGYVANRVYAAAFREATRVVEEGVAEAGQVDRLLMDCFRWPTGPLGMASGATSGWQG